MNKKNEKLYVDQVPTGLKVSVFLYDLQQQTKKLYNPAFILILRSLKLDEQLVMKKYAKFAVQSMTTTTKTSTEAKKQRFHRFPFNIYSPPVSQETVVDKFQLKDAKSEGLLQTKKENGQRKKPNEKEAQKKKTLNFTQRPITIQILQRQRRRRQKQKKMARLHQLKKNC